VKRVEDVQSAHVALRLCVACIFICLLAIAAQAQKKPPAKPLDLNAATAAQLEQLPGVGPTIAKAIVRFREKSGPFKRVEDLLAIRGITKKRLEKLRPYVFVAPASGPH
jgi:competence protein ComEA